MFYPYYLFESINKTNFYCDHCQKHHNRKDGYLNFFTCCVGDVAMEETRTCNPEYTQTSVDAYNERHNDILIKSNGTVRI